MAAELLFANLGGRLLGEFIQQLPAEGKELQLPVGNVQLLQTDNKDTSAKNNLLFTEHKAI